LRGPEGHSLTNLAFGGESRKILFVTDSSSGSILRADMDVGGMKLHRLQMPYSVS
jgi:gluconolactonase